LIFTFLKTPIKCRLKKRRNIKSQSLVLIYIRTHEIYSMDLDNYRDKDYDIFVILNKYSNQLNLMKDKFKTIVANNQKISDILFDKLSEPNDKIVKEVWEVLKLLPINKNVRKRIEKNSFDGTEVLNLRINTNKIIIIN